MRTKVVIIAGIVTCIAGAIFAIKGNKGSEVVATPVETTQEMSTSEDANIKVDSTNEEQAQDLDEILGGESVLEMPSNPAMESSTEAPTEPSTEASTEAIPETTAQPSKSETAPTKAPQQPETTQAASQSNEGLVATEPAPQPTAAPAEIESQVNEIQGAPVETIPQEAAQNMDDYYRSLAESLLAEPGAQERISELTSGGKDN